LPRNTELGEELGSQFPFPKHFTAKDCTSDEKCKIHSFCPFFLNWLSMIKIRGCSFETHRKTPLSQNCTKGDNSSVEVTGKGRIELTNKSFKNVLHVPKLSFNLLSVYQITNFGTGKKVVFTPNFVDIYNMQTNSRVATGEVNHQSRLYTFSEFIEPDSALLLTHANESSRIWHERFGHLNFRYMQQLSKHRLVDGLPDIHFSKGVCEGCVLGKHPQEKFDKGKS
jgi:hypothetical protein